MSRPKRFNVMISSRCNDFFPSGQTATTLSDIRHRIKTDLETTLFLGKAVFDVWINEDAPSHGGDWGSLDVCLNAVRDCDILLVVSNGNAGWAADRAGLGICHIELMAGLAQAPGKVRLIELGGSWQSEPDQAERDQLFQEYTQQRGLFRGKRPKDEAELMEAIHLTLHDAVVSLGHNGVREASRGGGHTGEALDWSRKDFPTRKQLMEDELRKALLNRTGSIDSAGHVYVDVDGTDVLFQTHAIPAALSVAAAREMVGQPFLRDHHLATALRDGQGGPVHVIACQKSATENQAMKMLGFPDATVIAGPFGIYVADRVQKVQFAFLVDCQDPSTTRHAVERLFEWLNQTGEANQLANRAKSRAKIVNAIYEEQTT